MTDFHKALLGPKKMSTKETLAALRREAPSEMAELEAALKSPAKPPRCEECEGTGIVSDGGPGLRNAISEWLPCDCPLGRKYKSIPEEWPEWKAEKARFTGRITVLEEALNELYHRTDCTTWQMEIINKVLPQKP